MSGTLRFVDSLDIVGADHWSQLETGDQPFTSYSFLHAMEAGRCLSADKGWQAHHAVAIDGDTLQAALPSYIKANSHGEFVYDWAWADAYARHGLNYYPKLITAVPYSPVTGTRLLSSDSGPHESGWQAIIDEVCNHCEESNFSSWHVNFLTESDLQIFRGSTQPFLFRYNWQYHWQNRGYSDFDAFISTLKRKRRKNIIRERKRVNEAGITIECLDGASLKDAQLDFVIRCYRETFLVKGNYPALTPDFFSRIKKTMPHQFIVMLASHGNEPIAASVFFRDGRTLYGRYWGATRPVPDLHFELCYYRGIEYCIEHGLDTFQPGAGGEYKIARGFSPVKTWSAHLIRHPDFHKAIEHFLTQEDVWLREYHKDTVAHSAYRDANV